MKKGLIVLMICFALLGVVSTAEPILPIAGDNYSTCGPVFPIGE